MNIENKISTADTRLQDINLKNDKNIKLAVSENSRKKVTYKKMTEDSVTSFAENRLHDKDSIHHQIDIKSQINTEITGRGRGPTLKGVIVASFENMCKEKAAGIITPLTLLSVTSRPLKNNIKETNNSLHKEIIKVIVQQKSRHHQDRINSDLSSSDNSTTNNYSFIDENPASYWQDLPDDTWSEKSPSEDEFTVPLRVDTADIRGILWNG